MTAAKYNTLHWHITDYRALRGCSYGISTHRSSSGIRICYSLLVPHRHCFLDICKRAFATTHHPHVDPRAHPLAHSLAVMSVLGERLWTHNATIARHGDEYSPGQGICAATNKSGCCHDLATSFSPGCANYLNPSKINSRMIKHRCRLLQRGFRPANYQSDVLPFQDK